MSAMAKKKGRGCLALDKPNLFKVLCFQRQKRFSQIPP